MARYHYRLLNVFCIGDDKFSGNPLCVFEDGRELSGAQMQALALQFNLSETTFILPSSAAHARVRIFTPTLELRFAGHPTLGTAHVVRSLANTGDQVQLELGVGVVNVTGEGANWALQAPSWSVSPVSATPAQLAGMLGIAESDIGAPLLWVDAGNEQLFIPVTSTAALERCQPSIEGLRAYASKREARSIAYVFTELDGGAVSARLFFGKGNVVVEDPATGSACANLGAYLLANETPVPFTREIDQGRAVGRPSRLHLRVDQEQRIFAAGAVIELGRGYVEL